MKQTATLRDRVLARLANSTEKHPVGIAQLRTLCDDDPDQLDELYRLLDELNADLVVQRKAGMKQGKTGTAPLARTLVESPTDKSLIPTINIEDATKALREACFEVKLVSQARNQQSDKDKKQAEAEKLKLEQETIYRKQLFDALHAQILADTSGPTGPKPGLYGLLAESYYTEFGYSDRKTIELYWPDSGIEDDDELADAFTDKIKALTTQQHFMLMMDMVMNNDRQVYSYTIRQNNQPETMLRVAKEVGIDAEKIKAEAYAEPQPKRETKPRAAKKAKA